MVKPAFRASKMPRILGCSGSVTLEALVRPKESDTGHEGVAIHHRIASRLIAEDGAQPPGETLPAAEVPAGYAIPKPSAWMVDFCLRHVRETIPSTWSLLVECEMEHEFAAWELTGHIDVLGISPDGKRAVGMDYKTGNKPVEPAEMNEQILAYLCLCRLEFPSLEEIEFHVVQPRASEDDGFQRVSKVPLKGTQLDAAVRSLDERTVEAIANPMRLNSGLVQCAHCDADEQCPVLIQLRKNMQLTLTPEMLANIKTDTPDEVLGDIAVAAKLLDKLFETAKDALKERLAARGTLQASDGTRITAKTTGGAYSVTEPAQFYRALRTLIVDEDRRAEALSFPLGRITQAISEEMSVPLSGKAAITAQSIVDAQLKPFTVQGQKTTLLFS